MYPEPPRAAMNNDTIERKHEMKKLIAMMLCIVLVLSLVACGNNTDETTEPTTEPTTEAPTTEAPTTEAPTEATEEVTEEITEGEIVAFPDFRFIEIDADWNEVEIEPTETMALLQSLYEGFPKENRPSPLTVRALSVDELAMNYLPSDIEGLEVVSAEPMMMGVAHFASIITVPEGTDAQTVVDYINTNIDPELRSKWLCTAAEAYDVAVAGNTIVFVMADQAFVEHCINTFNTLMAG